MTGAATFGYAQGVPIVEPNGHILPFLGLREPVSGLTHLLGAIIAAIGGAVLWARARGDRPKRISFAIYASTLVALLLASATYHLVDLAPERLVPFRKVDHASIFLLIAGTFTPFYVNVVDGWWRLGNLVLIWTAAALGITLKLLFMNMSDAASAGLYLGMGWLALIGYLKLASRISHAAMGWMLAGGVLYSAGAVVDVAQWPVPIPGIFGFHETFHVFVLAASAIHFGVVLRYVAPFERARLCLERSPA